MATLLKLNQYLAESITVLSESKYQVLGDASVQWEAWWEESPVPSEYHFALETQQFLARNWNHAFWFPLWQSFVGSPAGYQNHSVCLLSDKERAQPEYLLEFILLLNFYNWFLNFYKIKLNKYTVKYWKASNSFWVSKWLK